MILNDVLGTDVLDSEGHRLGEVSDVRFAVDAAPGQLMSKARLVGIIVSPRTAASFLGFERQNLTQPWPVAQLLRWRHRGSFLVLWEDIAMMGSGFGEPAGRVHAVFVRPRTIVRDD